MNTRLLLLTLGLSATGLAAQAQEVLRIGFEASETKGQYATADDPEQAGFFADHINLQAGDVWDEAGTDAHSGEYALLVQNANDFQGNTWHRGFKIRNVALEPGTSYRVSYWVKADATYMMADGTSGNTSVKNSLSIGIENVEAPIVSQEGKEYYYNYTSGMTGEWRHIKNVVFFTDKATQDAYFDNYNKNTYEDEEGNTKYYAEGMTGFPEKYFITINLYNPGTYALDDIVLEKATVAGADFNDCAVRIDFGYPTNLADLAKAAGGSVSFDPSVVTVRVNGVEQKPDYVEGKADGKLYAFFETLVLESTDKVEVDFAGDSRILYSGASRPSTDIESEMAVLPFSAEAADFADDIEEIPDAWSAPKLLSTVPENESFEISSADLKQVTFTYNKKIDITTASAVLSSNGMQTDLTGGISVAGDGMTLVVPVSDLADGEYVLTVSGVASAYGETATEDQAVSFQVGADSDDTTSEDVYVSDFASEMTGGIPAGWITYNEAGFHIYGFNDEDRTDQYNYNWGGKPGGGGSRLYSGFSGDFEKAMYWGTRGTTEGYASYGAQVSDWILPDGSIDPAMPDNIALYLEPRKYQVSFLMAAWKGEPTFNFTLEDLEGNVYARFNDITAAPNVNGVQGEVTGSVKCSTDFTVDKAGYYVLKFTAAEAAWQEYLLANVKLITMPSKAAYYKGKLAAAVEVARAALDEAGDEDYDGDTKTALTGKIAAAEAGGFTAPSAVMAAIDELNALAEAMKTRVANVDAFNVAVLEYADADAYDGTKYANTDLYAAAAAVYGQYGSVNPSTLSDADLAAATPLIVSAAAKMKNVKSVTDVLTWRIYKGTQTATTLADKDDEGNVTGGIDQAVIDQANSAITDDYEVADRVNAANRLRLYQLIAAGNGTIDEKYMTTLTDDQTSDEVTKGVELTGLVKNPKFYTMALENNPADNTTFPGWLVDQNADGGTNLHYNGTAPTADCPASNVMANNWLADYDLYQVVENVPAGVYDVELDCRTSAGNNAQNADGVWDKHIYAIGDDGQKLMSPFAEGGWGVHTCVVKNVVVTNGTLRFGAIENYQSGANDKDGDDGEKVRTNWNTNTFVQNARLFLVKPAEGFDYAKAAEELADAITLADAEANAVAREYYSISGARIAAPQRGITIVRLQAADGSTVTKKILVK